MFKLLSMVNTIWLGSKLVHYFMVITFIPLQPIFFFLRSIECAGTDSNLFSLDELAVFMFRVLQRVNHPVYIHLCLVNLKCKPDIFPLKNLDLHLF